MKENNSTSFSFHNTDVSREQFQVCADLSGFSLSEYARKLVNGKRPKEKPHPDFLQTVHQLKRIQSNLTQIATMSDTFEVPEAGLVHNVSADMRGRILRIRKEVGR